MCKFKVLGLLVMVKQFLVVILILLSLSLSACVATAVGLKSFVDTTDGYQFLYPNGWVSVKVNNGPDVVFHDLIEETENVSVMINQVSSDKTLAQLGTPTEVGYQLSKRIPNSDREAELVSAEERVVGNTSYYILEYLVKLPNQVRHDLASVTVRHGKLYSLNASTPSGRWEKVAPQFHQVVNSFTVY